MATQQRRIPNAKGPFNAYLTGSTAHLETGTTPTRRGEVLGLSPAELDEWIDYRDNWVPLFAKYNNPAQRTTTVIEDVNDTMENFSDFASPLLVRISASAVITNEDRDILHVPVRESSPTRRGKIEDVPFTSIKGIGGGQLKFRVRIDEDASRASMHPLADFLEVKYMILGNDPTPPPVPPTPGTDTPPTVDMAKDYTISKKAIFIFDAGTNNAGKFLIAFVRWANGSNPANNGPWSGPVVTLIV